ncbi:MAG: dihydrolipoyl dehydrogenase [Nitrospina sp.]|nr:dihydrolipoyl dehydrogenase [Nitrospina sp.]MBT6602088.1 dihydrolipoyl dehydrogenase [Nitrospina sp.]
MSKSHLVVLGAGPGGYSASFHAADQGFKVTLVDARDKLGGVCLHSGCIPSKALLHIAGLLAETRQVKDRGIDFDDPRIDLKHLNKWKDEIISNFSGGLDLLCKQRGINYVTGRGFFVDSNTIKTSEGHSIIFDHCIIATGSRPVVPSQFSSSKKVIMDSTEALKLSSIPKKLLIVGGGYIGLEMGTVYSAFGSSVTMVEIKDGLLPDVDRDLVRPLQNKLSSEFESIYLDTAVVSICEVGGFGHVTMASSNESREEKFDRVLMSVGRRPNIDKIRLENTKVQLDSNGFVKVDFKGQTSDPAILAIGDISGEPMLAHKASYEARIAIDGLKGKKVTSRNTIIPAVVFTDPEIAWCGLTESEAKMKNLDFQVAKFPWRASGRAHTLGRTEGFTKLILQPESKRVLGVGIIGYGAGELIGEGVLAINMGATADDLSHCIHPHPTLSETIMESADVFLGTATHIYKRPRK